MDNLTLSPMTLTDLNTISQNLQTDFDNFWNYNIFKSELENKNSSYIVAKIDNEIVGFGGIWNSSCDIHITNLVTKKNKRNLRNSKFYFG